VQRRLGLGGVEVIVHGGLEGPQEAARLPQGADGGVDLAHPEPLVHPLQRLVEVLEPPLRVGEGRLA